jgi:hypothetical protein
MKKCQIKRLRVYTAFSIFMILFGATGYSLPVNKVMLYPAPKGEPLNKFYKVLVNGRNAAVYPTKVGAADPVRRFKAVDDLMHSEEYYDTAAFSYFDMQGSATVTVQINSSIHSVKILPTSAGIRPMIKGHSLSFKVSSPINLTVEINGETVKSLHVFVNPIDINIPKKTDPNVIYFGPGIHEVSSLTVGDNKTVYIAGGAIIRAVIAKNEKFGIEPSGLKNYTPSFILAGHNIKFRGRGIIDASACPTHSTNLIVAIGTDINIEGVILNNSAGWTVPIRQSNRIMVNNIKILGYRANTDGIDIVNSRNVTVKKCFVRTNDDLIVVKSWEGQGKSEHIRITDCILYNQLAHALSLGAELREDVNDVVFSNCDIIHDQGREWSLRIFHSDASVISNISFENIRIEESRQLISLWIGKNIHSSNSKTGSINNVTFKNIKAIGSPLSVALSGGDEVHGIKNVTFQNIWLNKTKLKKDNVYIDPLVRDVTITP